MEKEGTGSVGEGPEIGSAKSTVVSLKDQGKVNAKFADIIRLTKLLNKTDSLDAKASIQAKLDKVKEVGYDAKRKGQIRRATILGKKYQQAHKYLGIA